MRNICLCLIIVGAWSSVTPANSKDTAPADRHGIPEKVWMTAGSGARVLGAAEACGIDKSRVNEDMHLLLRYIDEQVDNEQKGPLAQLMMRGIDRGHQEIENKETACEAVKKGLDDVEPAMRKYFVK